MPAASKLRRAVASKLRRAPHRDEPHEPHEPAAWLREFAENGNGTANPNMRGIRECRTMKELTRQ